MYGAHFSGIDRQYYVAQLPGLDPQGAVGVGWRCSGGFIWDSTAIWSFAEKNEGRRSHQVFNHPLPASRWFVNLSVLCFLVFWFSFLFFATCTYYFPASRFVLFIHFYSRCCTFTLIRRPRWPCSSLQWQREREKRELSLRFVDLFTSKIVNSLGIPWCILTTDTSSTYHLSHHVFIECLCIRCECEGACARVSVCACGCALYARGWLLQYYHVVLFLNL